MSFCPFSLSRPKYGHSVAGTNRTTFFAVRYKYAYSVIINITAALFACSKNVNMATVRTC
jgi:hypothetical protein